MSLLQEVAITPDVFLESGFSQPGFCDLCLGMLQPSLLEEVVVRDLRDGLWGRQFSDGSMPWHPAGQKLLKALAEGNRLVPAAAQLPNEPSEPVEWGWEAQASHKRLKLGAIISGREVYDQLGDCPPGCCAETIHESHWWKTRSSSVGLHRATADYLHHLDLVLRWANSLMFVDAFLDPSRQSYAEFHKILEKVTRRQNLAPRIELHRVSYDDSRSNRLSLRDLENRFADLDHRLKHAHLHAEVFAWDHFHDRYLISNLVGISLPNGFDISRNDNEQTTWARLCSRDRDDLQREFDPASNRHGVPLRFSIGI